LLAGPRISIADTKKSKAIFTVLLFIVIMISISSYVFFGRLTLDQRTIYVEATLLGALISCVVASLITVFRLKITSSEGRYYLSLAIGMAFWLVAEWTYSFYYLQFDVPYPSIADFFGY
jgi:hypothetical protein